jgi:RNA-directed DNA polymerase
MNQQEMELEATSSDLVAVATPEHPEISLAQLPYQKPFSVVTNKELAQKLGWKKLSGLTLLGKKKSEHYSILSIKKKNSSKIRILHNPDTLMRVAQYKILTQILNKIEIPEYIYAFEKGKNIPRMAEAHVGKAVVISIDLKDFFTSIKQYHLYALFQHLGFSEQPARLLSELCTYKSFVPQGALTSPKLSNLITSLTFGPTLNDYCNERGYTMTIYADDITISMDKETKDRQGDDFVGEIVRYVSQTVRDYNFRVNHEKTKVMQPYQRQYVCGVVVNQRINLQKSERNKLRAIVYNCSRKGIKHEAAKTGVPSELFCSKLMGRLNWFSQLNPGTGTRLKETLKAQIDLEQGLPVVGGEAVEAEMSADTSNTHQETPATVIPW